MGLNSKDINSIMKAGAFAFASGFISSLLAQGSFKTDIGWEGFLSMLAGAAVAGVNVALYATYRFFKTDDSNQPKPQA